MKKFFSSLPFRLLVSVVVGILLGMVFSKGVMNVVVTLKYILNQLIMFCVPLIIIGFIAPSITQLGSNGTKILKLALILAYCSSVGAALMSMLCGYGIIPNLSIATEVEGLKKLPPLVFQLDIPQILPVMSALVLSVMLGLAATMTKAKTMITLLNEFQDIVLHIVTSVIIPILPIFIMSTFCCLSYEGTITKQLPIFLEVILIILVGHYIWLALLYSVSSLYSHKNGFEVLKHYGAAYLTAVGTMSSAATLPVSLKCAGKSKLLRKDMVSFGIPLFANVHMPGSVLTEVFFVMTISKMLYGSIPSAGSMVLFCLLLGVFAIGAPGVPGGTVMASLGLVTGVLHFDATGAALLITIFALQDSFGTACNVTGDGALSLILTSYADRHGMSDQTQTA